MNQHFNSVQFFKCNDLVTENCLFVSLTDSHLSMPYHYNTKITFYFLTAIFIMYLLNIFTDFLQFKVVNFICKHMF